MRSQISPSLSNRLLAAPGLVWLLVWAGLFVGPGGLAIEWKQFRGPNQDGSSPDPINTTWSGAVTNAVWTATTRNGFSSFAVAGGQAITQVRRTVGGLQKEVSLALSITSGLELWSTAIDDAVYDTGSGTDDGPRTTPLINGDAVYVLSSRLKLFRLNASNGNVVWKTDLLAQYGGKVIPWQNAASPLLDSDRIYVNVNCGTRTLLALRAADGALAWRSSETEAMTHATPLLTTIHGVPQVIFVTQRALVSLEPSSGQRLWSFPYPFRYDTSLAVSPVVDEDRVFISGAYGMGSCAAKLTFANGLWNAQQIWSNDLASHWMTPVCYKGYLYGQFGSSSGAPFKCISMESGAEMWSIDGFGRGGTIMANQHLLALSESGMLVLIQPTPDAYVELGRFQAVTGKCWNCPAVSDGRVYLRSTSQAACYDLSVPGLKLQCAKSLDGSSLELNITTTAGAPLSPDRLAQTTILTTTNLDRPLAQWTKLNAIVATNGSVRVPRTTLGTRGFLGATQTTPLERVLP